MNKKKEKTIYCSVCQSKLSNLKSIVAGVGPVCIERLRFAETLESKDLNHFKSESIEISEELKNNTTLIIEYHSGEYKLINVLSVKEDHFICLDRQKMHQIFNQTKSWGQSVKKSLLKVKKNAISDYFYLDKPQAPDFQKSFRDFRKILKENLQARKNEMDHLKELNDEHKYYHRIIDKNDMNSHQKLERDHLNDIKQNNLENFQNHWMKAYYHKSTWLARLSKVRNRESKILFNFLQKHKDFKDIEIKDFGLTDDEISNALKHSNQKIASIIFNAYIKGNPNILLILSLAQNIKKLPISKRLKALKALSKMSANEDYSKEDLKRDLA